MFRANRQVRIERLTQKHAPRMCQWMKDPEVASNVGLRRKASLQKTTDWVRKANRERSIRAFAILAGDRHVGNVVLDQIDTYLNSARLSVYIGEGDVRGHGIGSTGVYLAMKHGFAREKLNKIWLTVHVMNYSAIRAYTNLGFALEGILRDEFWLDGKRISVLRMSVLRKEFGAISRP